MILFAASSNASGASTLTYWLLGGLLVGFGSARAIYRRAKSDHAAVKAAVKSQRQAKWKAFWTFLRLGLLALLAGACLIIWFGHDIRTTNKETPASVDHSSAPVPTPTRRR